MGKRDESIPSFSQVNGLPSSPSLEQKVVEEMEEVEKKKKGEEKKKKGEEEEKKKEEMLQSGSAGSSLVARIIKDPTTTTSGELEEFFPVPADGSSLQRGPDRIMGTLATGLVPLFLYLFQCFPSCSIYSSISLISK